MMTSVSKISVGLAGVLGLSACGGKDAVPTGPAFQIQVAPLDLPDVTDACYRVTVTNGPDRTGEIVWQEDALCADRFGDGRAAISYVGACDASDPMRQNSVTIELLDLMTGTPTPTPVADSEYVNPCAEVQGWATEAERDQRLAGEDPHGPCTINRLCRENADVLVRFDLTVMRDANQGFFDITVDFDDIFCSAKVDCRERYLHDGQGARGPTAIVAFACTAGEDSETYLYLSDLALTCGTGAAATTTVIPARPVGGQHGAIGTGVFENAVYIGDEQITSNGSSLEKCYWNHAIGLDLDGLQGPCTLSGVGTASDTPLTAAMLTAEGRRYPAVMWNAPIVGSDGSLCNNNDALDDAADGVGVVTTYLDDTTPQLAAALLPPGGQSYACGAMSCVAGLPGTDGAPAGVTVVAGPNNTIVVSSAGEETTVALPSGFSLGRTCERDPCCAQ